MTLIQALILAVVEGLTEYLPVSSTGHIILSSWLMGIHENDFVKDYTIMVQFGAIAAVLVLYWKKFLLNFRLYPIVFIAFLPAAVIGLAVKNQIDQILGDVRIVGIALLIGGVMLVLTDRWIRNLKPKYTEPDQMPPAAALRIGLFQLLAFIPGVSRSAASIWGGLHQRLTLVAATEFSFFLAVPTLTGASAIKFLKVWPTVTPEQIQFMLWGNVVSFFVGVLAIHYFVRLVARYGLRHFGYYRILIGIAVLAQVYMG